LLTNIFSNSKTKTFTIPENQQVKGNVQSSIAVVVCGSVDGDITTGSDLLIKTSGTVYGKISAMNVVVEGKLYGTISCEEKLIAKPGAHIEGQIEAAEINMEPGAVFVENKEATPEIEETPLQAQPSIREAKPAPSRVQINSDEKFTGVVESRPPKVASTDRWF
jgi:cytoskeletal protein CcmA (bactofilin family)